MEKNILLNDIVTLTCDFQELKKGDKGTVVHDYCTNNYEVEFIIDNKSIIKTLPKNKLKRWTNYLLLFKKYLLH